MTISRRTDSRHSWTDLGVRMGFTRSRRQRKEILAAIDRIAWIDHPARPAYLDSPAVRAVINAVFNQRRDQLRRVGVAYLDGGRRLVGLEDSLGTRSYVLDLGAEAVYVLVEFAHPLRPPRVA